MCLLWFEERALLFLWKPLFFRWPGEPVTSPVTLGCMAALKCSAVTEGVCLEPRIKPRTSVLQSLHYPPHHLSGVFPPASAFSWLENSRSDFPNAEASCHFQLPKFASTYFLWQILTFFYQSFPFQVIGRNFNRLERICFPDCRLKSMWLLDY